MRNQLRLIQSGIVSNQDVNLRNAYREKLGKRNCLADINEEIMSELSHISEISKEKIE